MKKIKTIGAILLSLSIAAVSHADPLMNNGPMGGPMARGGKQRAQMCEMHMQRLQKALNLSNAQMENIKVLKKEGFEAIKTVRMNLKNPVIEATKSTTFDKDIFVSVAADNARTLAQIKAEHMEKFYNILTPEQRQKFIELIKARKDHRAFMRGDI